MQSQIEKNVMAGVAAIYLGRRLASATALKLYALGLSLTAILPFVSVPHVLANLANAGFGGLGTFALAAVINTKLFVQLGLLVGAVAALSLAAEFVRAHRHRHARFAA